MSNGRILAGRALALALVLVTGLAVVTLLAPQTRGPLALLQVVVLHLVLATLVVGGIAAIVVRTRAAGLALLTLALVAGLRFGSELISWPADPGPGDRLAIASWNLELGARAAAEVAGPLLAHDADVVSLQELTPDAAAALGSDPRIRARYPYRALRPDPGVLGLGVLSAYPIVAESTFEDPVALLVVVELAPGRQVAVLDAHPFHSQISYGPRGLPVGIDSTKRDLAIARLRARIDDVSATGRPFVVAGDFNTTPTEPAYDVLADGLLDVHREVGQGPGWTWRPSRLEGLGVGLLRIDFILAGGGAIPAAIVVDCAQPGDHCLVDAAVVVP